MNQDKKNSFLPEGYKQPDTSNFFKLKDGENTFRIMSHAIVGYEYWTEDNKVVRSKTPFKETPNIKLDKDGKPTKIKHFWAFVVWNYESGKLQVAEITQSTIQSGIKALVDNKNWGDPINYDITITKSGEGFDTEYTVMPNPKSPIPNEAIEAMQNTSIDLELLYEGKNPFAGVENNIF